MISVIRLFIYCVFAFKNFSETSETFTVYRCQQHDLQGVAIGSRVASMECEAQALGSRLVSRKCLVLSLLDASIGTLENATFHNVAGVLVVLPSHDWSRYLEQHFVNFEHELLSTELAIPVYFVFEDNIITAIQKDLNERAEVEVRGGVMSTISNVLWSTGHRLVVHSAPPSRLDHAFVINVEGYLRSSAEQNLPVIVVCAHYDALSAIPSLSHGADANGSGVVALLELARIFAHIFGSSGTRPKYDLVFLLSGGGNYNYVGSKRWIDQISKETNGLAFMDSVAYVICLEGLGSSQFANALFAHLSRPPKHGSFSHQFLRNVNLSSVLHWGNVSFAVDTPSHPSFVYPVHKKINLNEDFLSWEHERFSAYRFSGVTLSSWPSHHVANQMRHRSFDGGPVFRTITCNGKQTTRRCFRGTVCPSVLARNTRIVAEALFRTVFEIEDVQAVLHTPFVRKQWITDDTVAALLDLVVRHPRSSQLLLVDEHPDGSAWKSPPVSLHPHKPKSGPLQSLEYLMKSLLHHVQVVRHPLSSQSTSKQVKSASKFRPSAVEDDRSVTFGGPGDTQSARSPAVAYASAFGDVDVVLYTAAGPATMSVYRLKSSAFDLFVAVAIGFYLAVLYFILELPCVEQTLKTVTR
ncbi:hypothetical protein EG68_09193 [Paragonimus skrjabini miyazakii]|uniref:BOS complex subunit NCLN n=1 Tax=Paragonimus skrjabini miyazakii TaxID=59628 RepID=A0A8S9Y917_9TREM|nr:hypothetical protein EG68_09193 [Paragonimus skrjabini miyazakii]